MSYNWDYFESIPTYHPIADANNLYDSFYKSRKGSHWKGKVQKYRWNLLEETNKLQKEITNFQYNKPNSYKLSPYSCFLVNQRGKVRAITALSIRDRVVKHTLNDLYLLPHIRPYLIYDNGASLTGKGVDFTRRRLVAHLESFFRETGSNEGHIMTMDFSGYYDNIDHKQAMKIIQKYETDELARQLCQQALDSYKVDVSYLNDKEYKDMNQKKFSMVEYRKQHHTKQELTKKKFLNKSLSVGDQTSQIIAVAFPTPIDNFIKIVKGYHYYGRYMDDFYIIAKTKEKLKNLQKQIYDIAKKLKIIINQKKTKITKIDRTFIFLQFKYYLKNNGHVVIRINPKTLIRMKRKMKKLVNLDIQYEKIKNLFQSWIMSYKKYMSKDQIQNIVSLYQQLYGHELDEWLKIKQIIKQ